MKQLLLSLCFVASAHGMQQLNQDLVRIKEKHWAIKDVASTLKSRLSQQQKNNMIGMLNGLLVSIQLREIELQHYVKLLRRYRQEERSINKLIERLQ